MTQAGIVDPVHGPVIFVLFHHGPAMSAATDIAGEIMLDGTAIDCVLAECASNLSKKHLVCDPSPPPRFLHSGDYRIREW